MDERTVSHRFGSVVPRINQLCLSVFHRAGGELISFSLNTNFFSGQKPISIKMARAFRILPDYKRLPSPPSPPPPLSRHAAFLSTDRSSNSPLRTPYPPPSPPSTIPFSLRFFPFFRDLASIEHRLSGRRLEIFAPLSFGSFFVGRTNRRISLLLIFDRLCRRARFSTGFGRVLLTGDTGCNYLDDKSVATQLQ